MSRSESRLTGEAGEGEVFIHPSAEVSSEVELGPGVYIGPFCVLKGKITVGSGTRFLSHVVIDGNTTIGKDNLFYPFSSAGLPPQDLKYRGEPSRVVIGDRNTIRESVTIHRGTEGGGMLTRIGDQNLLMANCHVAHDCHLGSRIVMANAANLAGHIIIEDGAIIGGLTGIHQFVRIGTLSMVGGMSGIPKDVPPYVWASGNRAYLYGLNLEGLKRARLSPDTISLLKKAYQLLFRSSLPQKEALDRVRKEIPSGPEIDHLVEFIEKSGRGVLTAPKSSSHENHSGDN
ncbi:acyl-ACP--UDP-N-acetylglucosamine O-acyltransferase [Leptospirillum ferriphilum]|uniref:Acyl-[acyl-carrier-protein]--UDP-N-acetylglucosamine O-acyltransferase n=2 Tax=Leptospirillum TaxID=179 RepID=A0A094X4G0_9BACT|nr:acyl-ACP--UDP-N-acetylglucosamine O-acyltransferase [Leptospirillum ferriphilum]EDZ38981.1 MAG: UDP-N-acetylglucosamine acyltransferase lipopolysaccharide biosynthesis [Leptospirillum sp. Group II '5-way CG']KGA93459.1 Acyl-[acyl-carrier-protein]--UDP-N- acetylglucosamine O-acyltransferase [Leptospirillum ferriphilum]